MIPVKVAGLRKGDQFRFSELSEQTFTLLDRRGDSAAGFLVLDLEERGPVTVPIETVLYAVRMYRLVKVPCLVHGEDVELLYDMASGGTPHAVLCGKCDEKVTAEVMRRMKEEE